MLVLWHLFALVGHAALWCEFNNRTHGLGWPPKLVDALTALSAGLFFGLPIGVAWDLATPSSRSLWLGGYADICTFIAIAWILFRLSLRWDHQRDQRVTIDRTETLDMRGKVTCPGPIDLVTRLPGNQLLQQRVEERTHPVANLPESLVGLRIVHLTDLHLSPRVGQEFLDAVVDRVNAWQADLVCLTGDIVERPTQLDWVEPSLGRIESRLGNYYILGNHDGKWEPERVRSAMDQAGWIDLADRCDVIADGELLLCGDERPWFGTGPSLPEGERPFTLLMAHTPDRFEWAIEQEIELMLAGHNHGGQVCFPLVGPLLCPSRHGIRYASGSFFSGATSMHASRGTGALFPIRMLCPPELGLITLAKA